jgi:NAD-dependent deacetylase
MKKKLVILSGAGISAESGIKTFRDTDGLWYGYKVEEVASIDGWRKDRAKVLDFYNKRRADAALVSPNDAHTGLADLEKDFDVCIITQNVDDLHERAGSTNVIHLHGELSKMCSSMDKEKILPYNEDIKIGDKHPDGSQLRPYIVWFGESVPMMTEAYKAMRDCEYFAVIGTSLQVYPAAGLVEIVPDSAKKFVIDKIIPSIEESGFIEIERPASEGVKVMSEMLYKMEDYKCSNPNINIII